MTLTELAKKCKHQWIKGSTAIYCAKCKLLKEGIN